MKDFLEKYNNLKQNNRRVVGFSKLGFWIVFFGIIILMAMSSSGTTTSNNNHENQNINDDTSISSYHFEYILNNQKYTGNFLNGKIELIGEGVAYYILDDKILTDNLDSIIPNYDYLNKNKINELIDKLEAETETSYKDGRVEYTYISKHNDDPMTIKYIKNPDKTINFIIDYALNHMEINVSDIDDKNINIDEAKYVYEYNKEDNNEY